MNNRINELKALLQAKEQDAENRSYWASWPKGIARSEVYRIDIMETPYRDYAVGHRVMVFAKDKPHKIFNIAYEAIATHEPIEYHKDILSSAKFLGFGVIVETVNSGAIVAWIPSEKLESEGE